MAYFLEENEMGAFVSPNIVPFILEGKVIDISEIITFRFRFLNDDYVTIIDKEFALKNSILKGEIIDLEKESKEDVFLN